MEPGYKLICDPESFERFRDQLRSCDLPADDLDWKRDVLVGFYENDALVGTGGLEIHGAFALLRSLSVQLGIRGRSVGSAITALLLNEARQRKVSAVYLLTETAHGFFKKKGFREVARDQVPEEVRASTEFSSVCPSTAAVMYLPLN